MAKRFKITGTGKILRRKQGKRHLLLSKNAKRKRNLGKATLVSAADVKNIKKCLPFS
ncbi:MAG: 50S ribosomal protein L35 [Verrucomicrobiales bacterium]